MNDHIEEGWQSPVPDAVLHFDKLEGAIHLLNEARGFAAMSPGGRDNIVEVAEMLPEIVELAYRAGFEDGEKHTAEHAETERKRNSSFVPVPNTGTIVHPEQEHQQNLREALEALLLQALQSELNSPANEWGWEAITKARAALGGKWVTPSLQAGVKP